MKNKLLILFTMLVCFVLCFALASCGDGDDNDTDGSGAGTGNGGENLTGITTQDLIAGENADYVITVKNSVNVYDLVNDFLPRITFKEGVTTKFSTKSDYSDSVGKTLALNEGDNFIYLKVSDENGNNSEYKFNIYRNKMLTLTFDPAGGKMDQTVVSVEEKETITPPTVVRAGYKFAGWDFDFKNPITENKTIVASWAANEYTVTTNVDGVTTEYNVLFGTVPDIKSPYKLGYNFAGWKLNGSDFDASAEYTRDANVTIVAAFEVISYNVQYVLGYEGATNSLENPTSFNVEISDIELMGASYDSNHIFLGWYTDSSFKDDTKITKITKDMIGKDLILYAKWDSVSSVTFDANGGECDTESLSFSYNAEYALPTPVLKNYVFDGWYNGETRLNNTGVWTISGDVTLVAKWNPRQNSIEYVLGYPGATNNSDNPVSYDVEDGVVELLPPSFDGNHIFAGWYTDPNFTEASKIVSINADNVTEEMILYAKWNTVSNVSFVTDCDTILDNVSLTFGQEYELPVVVKDKFTFVGWYDSNGKPVSSSGKWNYETDVELTAKWVAIEYQINFVTNGGSAIDTTNCNKYTVNTDFESFTIPAPTKDYANFDGWYFDKELTVPFVAADLLNYEGVTLYAKWNAITVTINYNTDGGSIYKDSDTVNLGADYVLFTTEKPGYDFVGWFDENGNPVESNICFTDPDMLVINLTAKWTLKKHKITYDLDGGTTSETLVTEYDVNTPDIKLPTPTKTGFYFVGWLMDDGNTSASVVIKKGSSGDRTFKAVWTSQKDPNTGLLFSSVDGKLVVVGIDKEINSTIVSGIKIPAYFNGVEVVGIDSYAFKAFGEKFTKTQWANMSNSYVIISVPTTVKKVGAGAFEGCNGIKVQLYDPNETYADYKTWDTLVTWESGNRSARDCIWGFRPAIGWTRYSKVTIPAGYDDVTD